MHLAIIEDGDRGQADTRGAPGEAPVKALEDAVVIGPRVENRGRLRVDGQVSDHAEVSDRIGCQWNVHGAPTAAPVGTLGDAVAGARVDGGRRLRVDGQGTDGARRDAEVGRAPRVSAVDALEDAAARGARVERCRRLWVDGQSVDVAPAQTGGCGDPGAGPVGALGDAIAGTRVEGGRRLRVDGQGPDGARTAK